MQKQIMQNIILRSAFCCCVFMKPADNKIGRVSWFNDFITRFSRPTKPCPQKLANFIDRLTSRLVYLLTIFHFVIRCFKTVLKSRVSGSVTVVLTIRQPNYVFI